MSAFEATLRVAGSMVTIDLPSTSPTIQPAAWAPVAAKADAASAPASASSFICLNMEVAPVAIDPHAGADRESARADASSYGRGMTRMQRRDAISRAQHSRVRERGPGDRERAL